jgi:hypothetical protein
MRLVQGKGSDFFAVEALGEFGAVRHMIFFVVKLETCEVHIAGIRTNSDGAWMQQIARQLTVAVSAARLPRL